MFVSETLFYLKYCLVVLVIFFHLIFDNRQLEVIIFNSYFSDISKMIRIKIEFNSIDDDDDIVMEIRRS